MRARAGSLTDQNGAKILRARNRNECETGVSGADDVGTQGDRRNVGETRAGNCDGRSLPPFRSRRSERKVIDADCTRSESERRRTGAIAVGSREFRGVGSADRDGAYLLAGGTGISDG